MIWTMGFGFYSLVLALLIYSIIRNERTKDSGDQLEGYISAMNEQTTKKAGRTVSLVTVLSLVLSVIPAGILWLLVRFVYLPFDSSLYMLNSGWVSLVAPSLFAFTLAIEFLLRSKWKKYAVCALYARSIAPPNYLSRKRFLIMQTISFALAFPFLIFSLGNYTALTDKEMRYSEYFSPAEYRYAYGEITEVESEVIANKQGNPDFKYTIRFSDGNSIYYLLSAYPFEIPRMLELIDKGVRG